MTRVLRYPRMSMLACMGAMLCALARDFCVGASLNGWARVLLVATLSLLLLCVVLMSCRLFVDETGIGVGFLLRVRRTRWEDVASLGLLCCNSRRRYLCGMYRGSTDLISLLHHAPRCGSWGFVAPASKRLLRAVCTHCPFAVDCSPMPVHRRGKHLRVQWHQAAFYGAVLLPAAAVAFVTGALMLLRASQLNAPVSITGLTLCAMALFGAGLALACRFVSTLLTCPAFSGDGICAGRGLYLPWDEVRFGYVHRIAQISGLFLLSQPLASAQRRGAPPILCLSMPDTRTLLLAYLMYCPHASRGMDIE